MSRGDRREDIFLDDVDRQDSEGLAPGRRARSVSLHTHLSAGKAISGAVPAIGNEPGRATLPVVSAVLARPQDIALFLAFLA